MRINIDKEHCVGHARCAAVAPEIYQLDDNGYIGSTGFDVKEGQEAMARRGARACPEGIITVEGETGKIKPAPAKSNSE